MCLVVFKSNIPFDWIEALPAAEGADLHSLLLINIHSEWKSHLQLLLQLYFMFKIHKHMTNAGREYVLLLDVNSLLLWPMHWKVIECFLSFFLSCSFNFARFSIYILRFFFFRFGKMFYIEMVMVKEMAIKQRYPTSRT